MTLERLKEWVDQNFPVDQYWSADDRMRDVETRFNSDGHDMNDQIRQLLLDHFTNQYDPRYRRIYEEMRQKAEDQRTVAEAFGGPTAIESITDKIVEGYENPEIMGVDLAGLATTNEEVVPPEIKQFARRITFTTRLSGFFKRIFGRR